MRLLQVIFVEIIVILAVVLYVALGGAVDSAYWWHLARERRGVERVSYQA